MLGLIAKVAGVATAAGFAAGVFTYRKAQKTKTAVEEKLDPMEVHTVRVRVPKGSNLEDCKIKVYVPEEDS